jgi:5'(3')-deoxyribonucleotidase
MIIAVDADGVVCDLHTEWYRRYNRDYNDTLTLERVVGWGLHEFVKPECGKDIYKYLSDPDLYDYIQPVAGAVEGVAALRALGHELVFVTACVYGMTDQKARWFERFGLCALNDGGRALPKDFFPTGNKNRVDAHLLIDDGAHNIRAWVEERQRQAILFEYPHNRFLLDEVHSAFWMRCHRVSTWEQIVRHIESLGA